MASPSCYSCGIPLSGISSVQIPFEKMTLAKYPDLHFCQECFDAYGIEKRPNETFEEFYQRVAK